MTARISPMIWFLLNGYFASIRPPLTFSDPRSSSWRLARRC